MAGIENSVGAGGLNNRRDVIEVQRAINRYLSSIDRLQVDGVCGPLTMAALINYQQRELRMVRPDGLVEPNRRTASSLLGKEGHSSRRSPPRPTSARATAAASRATTVADPSDPRLSGARWGHRNQARYPNSS